MKKKFKCMIFLSLLIAVLSFAGCSNVLDESAEKEHLELTEDISESEAISLPALDDDTNHGDSFGASESITPSGADSSIQPDATHENDKSGTIPTGAL